MAIVEYDGTSYHGFQLQTGDLPTIQSELERALLRITGAAARVVGAGRTDTGVHATGQVVSFRTESKLNPSVLRRALNAVLPSDIAVLLAADVTPDFHARFSARSREYRYSIVNRVARPALERNFALHVDSRLDVEAMSRAASALVGQHDFAAFAGADVEAGATVRNVLAAGCQRSAGDKVYVDVAADAFLPHMVRNIVGTLLLVGHGRLDCGRFEEIMASRDRRRAGPTAPARGLCLVRVNY